MTDKRRTYKSYEFAYVQSDKQLAIKENS